VPSFFSFFAASLVFFLSGDHPPQGIYVFFFSLTDFNCRPPTGPPTISPVFCVICCFFFFEFVGCSPRGRWGSHRQEEYSCDSHTFLDLSRFSLSLWSALKTFSLPAPLFRRFPEPPFYLCTIPPQCRSFPNTFCRFLSLSFLITPRAKCLTLL